MSYNIKNYTEQGGERTVVGGVLEIKEGASVTGLPTSENQAASTASTVAGVKDDLNALLIKLKNAGLMAPDTFSDISVKLCNAASGSDLETNHSTVSATSYNAGVFTLTADTEAMVSFESANPQQGSHKWLGILITTGLTDIKSAQYNGYPLTEADVSEAASVGGIDGDLILWLKCDEVIQTPKVFTLTSPGYENKIFTVVIVEPEVE
jgi:hypothetical protein